MKSVDTLVTNKAHKSSKEQNLNIVFIHGAWHGSWCWKEYFLNYFSEHGYTSYALDIRGHGNRSEKDLLSNARIKDYIKDVADFVSTLDSVPILVGHSMGGFIVQKYLELYSALAGVLMSSVPPQGLLNLNLRFAFHHPWLCFRTHADRNLKYIINEPNFIRDSFFSSNMPSEKQKFYLSLMQNESYSAALDMVFLAFPDAKKIKTPLLVMGASDDLIILPNQVRKTAKYYSTAPVIFPNMAHDMMLEENWMSVADYVIYWLEKTLDSTINRHTK